MPGISGSNTVNFLFWGKIILPVNWGSGKSGPGNWHNSLQETTESSVRFGSVRWFGVFSAVRFSSVRWKILTEPPNFLFKKLPEIELFPPSFFQLFHENCMDFNVNLF